MPVLYVPAGASVNVPSARVIISRFYCFGAAVATVAAVVLVAFTVVAFAVLFCAAGM